MFYLQLYLCTKHVCLVPVEARGGAGCAGTRVTDIANHHVASLEEQPVLPLAAPLSP